jgi:hypothetical protein
MFHFEGYWTWAEFREADEIFQQMMQTAVHPIALLMNFSESERLPPNSFQEIRNVSNRKNEQIELILVIGVNAALAIMGQVMQRLFPRRAQTIQLCASMSDAERMLDAWRVQNRDTF